MVSSKNLNKISNYNILSIPIATFKNTSKNNVFTCRRLSIQYLLLSWPYKQTTSCISIPLKKLLQSSTNIACYPITLEYNYT